MILITGPTYVVVTIANVLGKYWYGKPLECAKLQHHSQAKGESESEREMGHII